MKGFSHPCRNFFPVSSAQLLRIDTRSLKTAKCAYGQCAEMLCLIKKIARNGYGNKCPNKEQSND